MAVGATSVSVYRPEESITFPGTGVADSCEPTAQAKTFRRESIKKRKKQLGMELSGRQLAQHVTGPELHPQSTHLPTNRQDTHTPTLSPAHFFNVQSLSPKPPQICTQRSPSHDASL